MTPDDKKTAADLIGDAPKKKRAPRKKAAPKKESPELVLLRELEENCRGIRRARRRARILYDLDLLRRNG